MCVYAYVYTVCATHLCLSREDLFVFRQWDKGNKISAAEEISFSRKVIVEKDRKWNRSDCLCQVINVFHCVTSLKHDSP